MQKKVCARCGQLFELYDEDPNTEFSGNYCSELCYQAASQGSANQIQEKAQTQAGTQTHWFDKQVALDVLRYRFRQGKAIIRIATGFFTVRGYNLLRHAAHEKQMLILVGLDEPGEKRVRKALIQEILLDLRTGVDSDRRKAVMELVEKLSGGGFQIVDARAMQHHAKLYLVDSSVAVIGSANMTGRGLMEAIEAGNIIEDAVKVADLIRQYDEYFNNPRCVNISQELLEELRRWLQFVRPWDVYLKTLDVLKSLPDPQLQRVSYRKPVGFQNVVIARALRQIEETRGAMIVASTGLGKTIMGTDIALRLRERGEILNVIVIGPKPVEKEWRARLASAGLACDYFIHQELDASAKRDWEAVALLEAKLEALDELCLIILDESHELRNRYKSDVLGRQIEERRAFQRLVPAIQRSQCKVLLLTGTPYSTEVENINNQLYLLPHTASQGSLPGMEADVTSKPWSIEELQELKDSSIGSVITTPHVARYYGVPEGADLAIDFHGERRYIPHVVLYRVDVPLPLEEEIVQALDNGYFRVAARMWKIRTCIERTLRVAWGSSPWATREVIANVLNVGRENYRVTYVCSPEMQREALQPILKQLEHLSFPNDVKLRWLAAELQKLCAAGNKVIVFSEQLWTVLYLEAGLARLAPTIKLASTVQHPPKRLKKRSPRHKKDREIYQLLADFDPSVTSPVDWKYQVLLTTDAFGVGVNLQEAQVVINYDLAWTPIEPTQRAGRVLRLYSSPRNVSLYTLVPKQSDRISYGPVARRLLRRWEKLKERDENSTSLLDLPTLATQPQHDIQMATLAPEVDVFKGEVQIEDVEKLEISSIFKHAAALEPFKKEAQAIPEDISSALVYKGTRALMYVLLCYNGKYYWPLYDIRRKRLLPPGMDIAVILDYIACQDKTPTAIVDHDLVEDWSNACIEAWCRSQKVESAQVIRICAMYLKPSKEEDSFEHMLDSKEPIKF
jgi:superfamily II DNA or RNA helicase